MNPSWQRRSMNRLTIENKRQMSSSRWMHANTPDIEMPTRRRMRLDKHAGQQVLSHYEPRSPCLKYVSFPGPDNHLDSSKLFIAGFQSDERSLCVQNLNMLILFWTKQTGFLVGSIVKHKIFHPFKMGSY